MKYKSFFTVAALVCMFLMSAAAQQNKNSEDPNTRSLTGTVTDPGGGPVAGATVQLKDTKSLQIRSYVTKDDGTYHFAGLSTNIDYDIKAEHDGTSSDTKHLSNFDTHKTAVIDLKLKKGK